VTAHRKTTIFTAVLLASWTLAGAEATRDTAKAPATLPGLDAAVSRALAAFEVPGAALAIVKDGRMVLAKGYGVRRLGEPGAVDAKTLFGIASNTKVFTAVALGILVEEGKLAWDARVIDYLPGFQMWDPYVTRELTVRDLLVHRSGLGLGAGDLLWWPASTYNRKEIARRLRFIKPVASFRGAYAYDNVLYLVAGEVIKAVSGKVWEDFVGERILARIGMTSSNVRHSAALDAGTVAATHARVEGVVRPIKPFDSDNTNPAGGINSCAEDMAKWLLVLLADGKLPDGSRLFSERTALELVAPVTPMPNPEPPAELAALRSNFNFYALGLNIQDYRGRKVVTHTGGLPGYVSKVTRVPELGLGIAVLTNQESGEAFSAITYDIIDRYMGVAKTDWVDAFLKLRVREAAEVAKAVEQGNSARDASSKPSLPLEKFAGIYTDAWYGDIAIVAEGGKLVMRFGHTPSLVGDMEHWQHDTFIVRWRDQETRADAFVTFALDPDGNVEQAKMRAVSPETDFSFDFQDLLLRPAHKPAA
jgi:CubicO group peptidase (beta-lactamase class C family)